MFTKNYKVVTNKEGKVSLKAIDFNVHSSVIAKDLFVEFFTREKARYESAKLYIKLKNCEATSKEIDTLNLLTENFEFTSDELKSGTYTDDFEPELIGLLRTTLLAHNLLYKGIKEEKKEDEDELTYSIVKVCNRMALRSLYRTCKNNIASYDAGACTLEEVIELVKPVYNSCTEAINHEAENEVCKKWIESTKEKNTKAFVNGLLGGYRLTKFNTVAKKNPLSSLDAFESYVAMWLVTEGKMEDNNKNSKDSVIFKNELEEAKTRAMAYKAKRLEAEKKEKERQEKLQAQKEEQKKKEKEKK